ncbi:MAG TPA: FAD-dependent monooxygenase [Usitatibacter sp.]|jgi:2-octaprenyl-6-methoxyphenol hydroxylase|nr:FAD-dependent monooxygenase [Usitatibacter sp.]
MLDVAILGGGPVGAAVAAMAAGRGLRMEVFEAREFAATDARTLALSDASRERLRDALAWPAADATPIAAIHVSQKGAPGRTLIHASDLDLEALGYTVPFTALQQALHERLAQAVVPLRFSHECQDIRLEPGAATLRFRDGSEVRSRLLVLADGGANAQRIPGIGFSEKDYGQHAVVAAVRTDRPHRDIAYERFTPQGPVALLPVADRYALVWTATPERAAQLIALPEEAFLAQLQAHFGDRAGRFVSASGRASFPLRLRSVNTPIALRTVIVGNAAQALHPIAGQGLNLGLRDATALAQLLVSTPAQALGERPMLDAYRAMRRRDAALGIGFTDFLVSSFADTRIVPTLGRAAALAALDLFRPARRLFAARMVHGAAR